MARKKKGRRSVVANPPPISSPPLKRLEHVRLFYFLFCLLLEMGQSLFPKGDNLLIRVDPPFQEDIANFLGNFRGGGINPPPDHLRGINLDLKKVFGQIVEISPKKGDQQRGKGQLLPANGFNYLPPFSFLS